MFLRFSIVALVVLPLVGCEDKPKASFTECEKKVALVKFEHVGDPAKGQALSFFKDVRNSCETAAKDDPQGEYGQQAREHVERLDGAIAKIEGLAAEREERDRKIQQITSKPAAEPADCMTLCKKFAAKRAECVVPFTAKLTIPPAMKADVIAGHKKNAAGQECPDLCDTIAKTVVRWGKCASEATCDGFVSCYAEANK